MISNQVVSVGTAEVTLALPTIDAQSVWVENLSPVDDIEAYSKDGYQYCINRLITLIADEEDIVLFETGPTGAQINHYELISSTSDVYCEFIEGATITSTGTAIPGTNHNRNFANDYASTLEVASALTGGTVIVSEYLVASNQAASWADSGKIFTFKPNTQYAIRCTNQTGVATTLHMHIGWSEQYNGYNKVWINGSSGSAVSLSGGERIQLDLQQGEGLTGVAIRDGVRVAVMRQD